MVEQILEQQQPICATVLELRKGDLKPTDQEFSTIEAFKEVMEPIVKITEAIGADTWVTISSVRPILNQLLDKHSKCSSSDSHTVKSIEQAIHKDLKD